MLKNYIKLAFRVMLRQKFFTAVSLFGISFTIMIFSFSAGLTNLLIGNVAPGINRDRTLYLESVSIENSRKYTYPANGTGFFNDVKKITDVERMSLYITANLGSYNKEKKVSLNVSFTDEEMWNIYKHEFLEGRPYTRKEAADGQSVAVITQAVKKFYFGEGSAVGKTLPTTPGFRVIGVVKDFLNVEDAGPEASTVFVPLMRYRTVGGRPAAYKAVILAGKKSDLTGIKNSLLNLTEQKYNPTRGTVHVNAVDIYEAQGFDQLIMFLGIFIFFMMIVPALNLVGLNINRIAERSSEIGIRKSFGASSSVLAGQFLTENIITTLLGGILGILLTIFCSGLIIRLFFIDDAIIPSSQNLVNWTMIFYAILASLFFALLSGFVPAWKMSRLHIVKALKGGNL